MNGYQLTDPQYLQLGNGQANYYLRTNGAAGLTWANALGDVDNYLASSSNVLINTAGNITSAANISAGNFVLSGAGNAIFSSPGSSFEFRSNLYVNSAPVGSNLVITTTGTAIEMRGDVVAENVFANYFYPNGAPFSGGGGGGGGGGNYSNANVAAYLPTYTGNLVSLAGNITTAANISGNYVLGNGAFLTGITAGSSYSNANVANYLPTYTGNLVSLTGNVITTANVTGGYVLGNGRFLTGVMASGANYGNANVAAYLPTYTGNISSGNLTATGILRSNNIITTGTGVSSINSGSDINLNCNNGTGQVNVTGSLYITGQITTSAPAFIATITSNTNQGVNQSSLAISTKSLSFNNVVMNTGNGYDANTGIFTAPIAGFYQVSAACSVVPMDWSQVPNYYGEAALLVYKNGLPGVGTAEAAGNFIDMLGIEISGGLIGVISASSISSLIYLNAGDTLRCVLAYITNAPNGFWVTNANLVRNYFQACWLRS